MPAGIAVVRISGPDALSALHAVFRAKRQPEQHPREMILGELVAQPSGAYIDQALAVFMPAPMSFTGEHIVEFQFHGSMLLANKLLQSLYASGCQPAQAGEFTQRAFLNGKIDLVQAEAIADLISAQSEQALKLAEEQLRGRFSQVIEDLGSPLRDVLAEVEASIDFPEEDIQPETQAQLERKLLQARQRIHQLLDTYSHGQVLREGFRVLLCGRPNAGKSSLLNLLLGTQRAIVSEVSGTTRDLIEEQAFLGGYRFVFCDSAGIGSSNDIVEQMGIELAKERIPWADLVLLIVDASDPGWGWLEILDLLRRQAKKIWLVVNKLDLNPQAIGAVVCDSRTCERNFYLSAKTKSGFAALTEALIAEVQHGPQSDAALSITITNQRQRQCLLDADVALTRTLNSIRKSEPLEIVSISLREVLSCLDQIIGRTYTEDILARVFSKFCIGK